MSADAVVHRIGSAQPAGPPATALAGLPRQRRGAGSAAVVAPVVEHHPVRRVRRMVLCHLGVHTSVFAWAPGLGVWCNHCHTQVAEG